MYPRLFSVRAVLLCFLSFCFFASAYGQQKEVSFDRAVQFTPGGLLDTVFDLQGKKYTLGQIAIDRKIRSRSEDHSTMAMMPASCSSGYFQMYLEPGCGMDGSDATSVARLNVLCRVLYDISNLINSPCASTGQKVNIWVRAGLSGSAAGVASPFFNVPYSFTASGIADNAIWITLNSGRDAFTNVASPLSTSGGGSSGSTFFHGSIAFNFTGSLSWHTNLATTPTPGTIDLYTVALHEMLHALGFLSIIDFNGNSVFGTGYKYFSRYDTHLKVPGGPSLLTTSTPGCGIYNWDINSALAPISNYLSPGGTTVCPLGYQTGSLADHTICANRLEYAGSWPLNIPIYTPECFEKGSSLSHFEDECHVPLGFMTGTAGPGTNNQYFVMSNSAASGSYSATTNPGVMKRCPTPEERQTLCDIGYGIDTSFGDPANLNYITYSGGDCPGLGVAGINDGLAGGVYTYTTSGTAININPASAPLLGNDFGVTGGSFKCLEVVSGGGTLSVATGTATTPVIYTPSSTIGGVQLLRYIPVSSTGVEGNITYVYVYVVDGNCIPTACDLVCNGGFENVSSSSPLLGGPFSSLRCWAMYAATPDLFTRGCPGGWCFPGTFVGSPGVHPGDTVGNNRYVGGVGWYSAALGDFESEAFYGRLSTSLVSGQTYKISFWAKLSGYDAGMTNVPIRTQFAVSPVWPFVSYSTGLSSLPSGLTLLDSFEITQPDIAWHHYSAIITYSGPPGCQTLAVIPAPWSHTSHAARYVLFDDISIIPLASTCSFYLPDTISACTSLDLDSLVSIPGGTFSWYRDSAGYVVVSHDHIFDPAAAYDASVVTGNNGIVSVCYKYTTSLGCVQEVCEEVLVNYAAGPIVGVPFACIGIPTSLSHVTPGGTWSSSDTTIATITSIGVMVGVAAGTSRISYQLPTGCYVTRVITVNVNPSPILPASPAIICTGRFLYFSNSIPFGTWSSSNTSVATINSSALSWGMTPGTCNITYTVSTGCFVIKPVTVNLSPSAISPSPAVMCIGTSLSLTNTVPGGTWTSSNSFAAPIDSVTGVVFGLSVGISAVSYTIPNGCFQSTSLKVNPYPTAITPGLVSICAGDTMHLHTSPTIGSWSSSDTLVAKIDTGGLLTGMGTGTCNITYNIPPNCFTVITVTVALSPTMIIPAAPSMCIGNTTTLLNSVPGGVWNSSNPVVAPIVSSSGYLVASSLGTSIVTYTMPSTGCYTTTPVTVNSNPLPITPSVDTFVCVGNAIALSDATSGGTWSTSSSTTAMVSTSGLVTGMSPGMVTIFYILPTGCSASKVVTVNPAPSAIAPGIPIVCMGRTLTLSNTITGGTWTSSNVSVASVGSASGIVTPATLGTTTVTYNAGGCQVTTIVTVSANPAPITPSPVSICIGSIMTLSDATPGGAWVSGSAGIASVTSGGVHGLALGTCLISYTLPTGCYDTVLITVQPPLAPIVPSAPVICSGATITLAHPGAGGTWSSVDPTTATISSASGVASGVSNGTTIISYTVGYCAATTVLTVNSSAISPLGPTSVCVGSVLGLTALPAGGTWISSSPFIASVGATGAVTGLIPGVTMITYTNSFGCFASKEVTVNEAPAAMTPGSLCVGSMLHLTNSVTGGSWVSANTTIATVATSGWVSGVASGVTTIDYILPNGCFETVSVTVDPLPISGSLTVNVGATTTLTNPSAGGSWYSANPAKATVGATNGIVTGVAPGTADINYTLASGCKASVVVTVIAATFNDLIDNGFASLAVIPNPNEGSFTLTGILSGESDESTVEIQVIDVVGRVVKTESAELKQGLLNAKLTISNNLANGQYLIKVKATGATQVIRFLLER